MIGNVITPTPDYAKLAEAYGGVGERVEKTADLEPPIERALAALASGRTARLDVLASPSRQAPGRCWCWEERVEACPRRSGRADRARHPDRT